jgi:hypothetical protein
MKKVYSMPEINVTSFENEVIMAASSITVNRSSQTSFTKTISMSQLK